MTGVQTCALPIYNNELFVILCGFCSSLTEFYLAFCCYLHHQFFNQQRFRAEGILFPNLHKALFVACNTTILNKLHQFHTNLKPRMRRLCSVEYLRKIIFARVLFKRLDNCITKFLLDFYSSGLTLLK